MFHLCFCMVPKLMQIITFTINQIHKLNSNTTTKKSTQPKNRTLCLWTERRTPQSERIAYKCVTVNNGFMSNERETKIACSFRRFVVGISRSVCIFSRSFCFRISFFSFSWNVHSSQVRELIDHANSGERAQFKQRFCLWFLKHFVNTKKIRWLKINFQIKHSTIAMRLYYQLKNALR